MSVNIAGPHVFEQRHRLKSQQFLTAASSPRSDTSFFQETIMASLAKKRKAQDADLQDVNPSASASLKLDTAEVKPPYVRGTSEITWSQNEECAEAMIPIIGNMYRKQNTVTTIFGTGLTNQGTVFIVSAFRQVEQRKRVPIQDALFVLQGIERMKLQGVRIDIGKATLAILRTIVTPKDGGASGSSLRERLSEDSLMKILVDWQVILKAKHPERPNPWLAPRDVVLYGFGRIGRILLRILIEKTGSGVKLMPRAIVVRPKKVSAFTMSQRQKSIRSTQNTHTHNGLLSMFTKF